MNTQEQNQAQVQNRALIVNESQTVSNYPYGSLRTTATFSLDFNYKKGFRSVFQTVNPKTGRINNPKKGTYNDIMYMSNTDGFVKFHSLAFYRIEDFNQVTTFLADNFDMFTTEQIKYVYGKIISFFKLEMYTLKVYCNVETAKSFEVIGPALKTAIVGYNNPQLNQFNDIKIDHEAINALKDPNYQPFKVTTYGI